MLTEKEISKSSFFYMYYYKRNINCYQFNKGHINSDSKNYPKLSPYFLLTIYNDLFYKKRFGNKSI